MVMLIVGIVLGVILTIAVLMALYIISTEPEEGDEWTWRRPL